MKKHTNKTHHRLMCGGIRTDIGIKYFLLVHAYRIILNLDCDFVGVLFCLGWEWGVVGREA